MVTSSTTAGNGNSGPDDAGMRRKPGLTPVSLFLVLLLFWIMTQIQIVLVLGLLALLFGTILEGPVSLLERRHVPRPAAIAAVYVIIIGALVLLVVAIVPVVADQADTFKEEVPAQLHDLRSDWEKSSNPILSGTGADLLQRGIDLFEKPSNGVSGDTAQAVLPFVVSIGTGLVSTISLLVIVFYYLMEKSLIRRVIIDQLPLRAQGRVNRVWGDVERKVGGWIRGQLLLCLVIGTIATISYAIIDLPFWPLLGLWAGLTEILPIVGPWIGGVPAVILALTVGWDKALITAIIIIAMQSLENWFLVPRIMRGAVGLTPLTVFVAILAGQQFLGIVGAVLAIPVAAAIQVIITDWLDARRAQGEIPPTTSGWRWMLSRAARDESAALEGYPPEELPVDPGHQQQVESDVTFDMPTNREELQTEAEHDAETGVSAPVAEDSAPSSWSWHRGTLTTRPKSDKRDE